MAKKEHLGQKSTFLNVKSQDDIKNYGAECVNSYKRVEQHIQFFLVLGVVYAFDHMLNQKQKTPFFINKMGNQITKEPNVSQTDP